VTQVLLLSVSSTYFCAEDSYSAVNCCTLPKPHRTALLKHVSIITIILNTIKAGDGYVMVKWLLLWSCLEYMKAKESVDILAKLIIIGDSGVGKTNLILSFVGERFK
jgi:hypothetical protein